MDTKETSQQVVDGERPTQCCEKHEWVVFSTALNEGWLMLQCIECGVHATVDDPTVEEWSKAFHAPSTPYRWHDEARITLRNHRATCVVRRQPGDPCGCIRQGLVPPTGDYERVLDGAPDRTQPLKEEERRQFELLSETALDVGLCSRCMAGFLVFLEDTSSFLPCAPLLRLANRIEQTDNRGLHMSPGVVSHILSCWSVQKECDDVAGIKSQAKEE